MIQNNNEYYSLYGDSIATCAVEVLMWLIGENKIVLILKNIYWKLDKVLCEVSELSQNILKGENNSNLISIKFWTISLS